MGAVLNSAYIASMLECTEAKTEKLAHIVDVEYPSSPTPPSLNKLSYLEHRTMDLFKNHGTFTKLSYTSCIDDIDLFSESPDEYYAKLGYEILAT
jgi:hypothetical protein